MRNPFVVVPVLIGIILPVILFAYFRQRDEKPKFPDDAYFSNIAFPEGQVFDAVGAERSAGLMKGEKLILLFTTSCEACKKEAGLIAGNYQEISGITEVIGISAEPGEKIALFADEAKANFPLYENRDGKVFSSLGIRYFPTKLLIRDGVIVKTVIGSSPDIASFLNDLKGGGGK